MSNLLWKYYLEDDVESFAGRLAVIANPHSQHTSKGHGGALGVVGGGSVGSPVATSPKTFMKNRKTSWQMGSAGGVKGANATIARAEVNMRDYAGLTILHRAASSSSTSAISFALALVEHPMIDLYIQDLESGWTALHRALYFGNVTIARAIMIRDRRDFNGLGDIRTKVGSSVIKVKDFEGNSPFDVYNATIARRTLQHDNDSSGSDDGSDEGSEFAASLPGADTNASRSGIEGDELYVFGSNKNHSLGFGDGDDRQHPEKITLRRPDHLLFRFYREYQESCPRSNESSDIAKGAPKLLSDLPALILNRPVIIHDVVLAKYHSAILTTDPEANLYMCGFGPGGRLGTGDETTRFTYVCIEEGGLSGKKISTVALGSNHTLAVTSEGEIFSWGTSKYGQLGYNLPNPAKDEDPISCTPRQIFGPLKRETILGVAASAIHSVAHTSNSLFCWGKNEGQLGLMDSDSRSLAVQQIPRKVAASLFKAPIKMVSAINGATICLLANHAVCVFTNYGYNMVKFPLYDDFSRGLLRTAVTTRYDDVPNHITSITAGGDTIAALSSRGDLFTIGVKQLDSDGPSTSTTNPSKIKSSLSSPQTVWSLRKGHWDGIKSVGVAENGSVIVCTHAGAVWRRVKRPKVKDAFTHSGEFTRKDFKFQRVPGLTNVAAVRSTPFGVYAAIRKDCDVTRTQIHVDNKNLWDDLGPLLSVLDVMADPKKLSSTLDAEADVNAYLLTQNLETYDIDVSTSSSDVLIPAHGFMLAGRSSIFRSVFEQFRRTGDATIPDLLAIHSSSDSNRSACVVFQKMDFLTVLNLVTYLYTDKLVPFWQYTRELPSMAFRYRQIRVELMKIAAHLKMTKLESAVRLMAEPEQQMNMDLAFSVQNLNFFEDGDTLIELDGDEVLAHSALLCRRCPFFDGLFNGRSGGRWLAARREGLDAKDVVRVDLKHMDPQSFAFVLRYLYADIGTEIFDDVVSSDIDEFSELVLDVMELANELMLDRLSQICQEVIGRFVNTRNVSQLLNFIAPYAVTEFRDTALEYICIQLEFMLENHLIDNLDDDLLMDLDEVVRGNQLNCLPFAKSGRAEMLLHDRHPDLAGDIDEERTRRVRDMAFRANLKDEDMSRARVGSSDDLFSGSPSRDKLRRKSKATSSPSLPPKDTSGPSDLMFDMDDDLLDATDPKSPASKTLSNDAGVNIMVERRDSTRNAVMPSTPTAPDEFATSVSTPPSASRPQWSSPSLSASKLDMKEIMAQASSSRVSNLSISISAQRSKEQNSIKAASKMSQKDRKKKQQQEAMQLTSTQPHITLDTPDRKSSSPWQVASKGPKTSLKDLLQEPTVSPLSLPTAKLANPTPPRRTASPDTRFAGQRKKTNQDSSPAQIPKHTTDRSNLLIPHSKSYSSPASRAEPALQLSMSDIIGQQRREQELVKEAVAKRSLQEIQEEQAFQEWWDQESKRAQEESARAQAAASTGRDGKSGRGKGNSRGRGRGRSGATASRGDRGGTRGDRGKGREKL